MTTRSAQYVLHFEPAYRHACHYVGWALDVEARLAEHLAGAGSPLVRAAVAGRLLVHPLNLDLIRDGWDELRRLSARPHRHRQPAHQPSTGRRHQAPAHPAPAGIRAPGQDAVRARLPRRRDERCAIGCACKRKDDIYRMAQANKPFAHYRWWPFTGAFLPPTTFPVAFAAPG